MNEAQEIEYKKIGKTVRRARKTHRCRCGRMIFPGETYTREVYLLDGDIMTDKIGGHACLGWYEPEGEEYESGDDASYTSDDMEV